MDDALQYTAFVDIMGFADGQESLAIEDAERLTRVMAGEWLLHPELSNPAKTLFVRYEQFHEFFEAACRELSGQLALKVSFSDSGFVAALDRRAILQIAAKIIQDCYRNVIPIRIGIGRGTVGYATFSVALTERRVAAQSQIFGTGIIRAYRAHNCVAKGFRVFLHPSAELPEDDELSWLLPRLEPEDQCDLCVRELNFMYQGQGGNHDWLYFDGAVDAMCAGVTHPRALLHCDASARALERFETILLGQFGPDTIIRVRPGRLP
jgi:hypothetical protein